MKDLYFRLQVVVRQYLLWTIYDFLCISPTNPYKINLWVKRVNLRVNFKKTVTVLFTQTFNHELYIKHAKSEIIFSISETNLCRSASRKSNIGIHIWHLGKKYSQWIFLQRINYSWAELGPWSTAIEKVITKRYLVNFSSLIPENQVENLYLLNLLPKTNKNGVADINKLILVWVWD